MHGMRHRDDARHTRMSQLHRHRTHWLETRPYRGRLTRGQDD